MRTTRLIMGMPVTVEIIDSKAAGGINSVFDYFELIDNKFSTYKPESEISKINRGALAPEQYSDEMREVLELSEQTKRQTDGYFNIRTPRGIYDPSGLVKGWAIYKAARMLTKQGFPDFFIDAGGDVQVSGQNSRGQTWSVGIRNPFKLDEIVKVLRVKNAGVATSGSYLRGRHIYNPRQPKKILEEIVSVTVIGPNVYEADRFATAAFAMGRAGIKFIESQKGLEGYVINKHGMATQTSGI